MATALFAAPMLPPGVQLCDANGDPLNGGKVYVYQAGTTTDDSSYPTYADALAGTNANANPVVLDSAGRAQVWLQATRLYKIVVKDSTGATTIQTMDSYSPAVASASPAITEWVRETNSISYSSSTQFIVSSTDVTDTYHTGRRIKVVCTAGTLYGSVDSSAYATNTTVKVMMDGGGSLDSGLSQVNYALVSAPEYYAGHPSTQDRPSFVRVYRNGAQSLTGTSWNKIQFETEEVDAQGEYDSSTNYRFTPKYQPSGVNNLACYLITAKVTLTSSVTSAQIAVYRNGSAISTNQQNMGIAGGTISITHIEYLPIGGGNYYEIFVNPTGTTNLTTGTVATALMIRRLQ